MVFHWSLSDNKSPQVSRTRLSILAVLITTITIIITIIIIISYLKACNLCKFSVLHKNTWYHITEWKNKNSEEKTIEKDKYERKINAFP